MLPIKHLLGNCNTLPGKEVQHGLSTFTLQMFILAVNTLQEQSISAVITSVANMIPQVCPYFQPNFKLGDH